MTACYSLQLFCSFGSCATLHRLLMFTLNFVYLQAMIKHMGFGNTYGSEENATYVQAS